MEPTRSLAAFGWATSPLRTFGENAKTNFGRVVSCIPGASIGYAVYHLIQASRPENQSDASSLRLRAIVEITCVLAFLLLIADAIATIAANAGVVEIRAGAKSITNERVQNIANQVKNLENNESFDPLLITPHETSDILYGRYLKWRDGC